MSNTFKISFFLINTDQIGTINLKELKDAFQKMRVTRIDNDLMEKIFAGIDDDRSGQIHHAEFLANPNRVQSQV